MKRLLLVLGVSVSLAIVSGSHLLAQEPVAPPDEQVKPITPPDDTDSVIESNDTLDELFEKLRKDADEKSAGVTARKIWREWRRSGSASIDLLMQYAAKAMNGSDNAKAEDILNYVTVNAPEFAEGWNRRATLYYHMNDFGRSLADIKVTLELEPRHFGAWSGLAGIMMQLEKDEEALKAWYKVLEIYPANPDAQKFVIELENKLAGQRT